jgi:hypothetical protein
MSRNLRGTDVNTLTRAEIEDWIQADYRATLEMMNMRRLYLQKSGGQE